MVLVGVGAAYLTIRGQSLDRAGAAAAGALAGAVAGAFPAVLVVIMEVVNLRAMFLHASPGTSAVLTLGLGVAGAWIPIVALAAVGAATGLLLTARADIQRPATAAPEPARRRVLTPFALIALILLVVWLPHGVGSFFAQVVAVVVLYILMGLGLKITLGLAGLLDLGFVAFFAVGAYTVGLLTSTAEYGIALWPFWAAVPFAVLLAMAFGAFFGLPILGIRGDYLAIATLGFGEIIRILAGSDLLKPPPGGPPGVFRSRP